MLRVLLVCATNVASLLRMLLPTTRSAAPHLGQAMLSPEMAGAFSLAALAPKSWATTSAPTLQALPLSAMERAFRSLMLLMPYLEVRCRGRAISSQVTLARGSTWTVTMQQ